MADTFTTNLNLTKPEPGAAEDTWGISLNSDLDALDAIFGSGGTAVSMGNVTTDRLNATATTAFSTTANTPNASAIIGNSAATTGNGNYKGALGFAKAGTSSQIRSAIVGKQTATSNNVQGLAFLVHPNSVAGTLTEALLIKANNDIIFYDDTGTSENMVWDASADSLNFVDNAQANFGSSNDLSLLHNGTDSVIKNNNTGQLYINNFVDNKDVIIRTDNGSGGVTDYFRADGSTGEAKLYNYGDLKFKTSNTGIDVTGTVTSDGVVSDGNVVIDGLLQFEDSGGSNRTVIEYDSNDDVLIKTGTSSGSRSIKFQTEASEVMRIDANARVGIGTSSPSSKLHVKLGGIGDDSISLVESSGSATYGVYIKSAYAEEMGRVGALNQADGGLTGSSIAFKDYGRDIVFNTHEGASNSEKVRIKKDGKVGLGTSSPSYRLHLHNIGGGDGIALQDSNDAGSTGLHFLNNSGTIVAEVSGLSDNTGMTFETAGSERMRIDSSGNVGIGETAPSDLLHINKSQDAGTQIQIENQNTGTSSYAGLNLNGQGNNFTIKNWGDGTSKANATEFISTASGSHFIFSTQSTERARIDSNGNFAIGTTSPSSSRLTVEGDIRVRDSIASLFLQDTDGTNQVTEVKQSAGVTTISSRNNTSNGAILFTGYNGSTTTEYARFDSGGDFGIGTTSPGTPLHVESSLDYVANFKSTDTTSGILLTDVNAQCRVTNTNGNLVLSADKDNQVANTAIRFMLDTSSNAGTDAGMVLRSTGLGIGTASPLHKLDVRQGNIMVGGYGSGSDFGLIFTPADSETYWHIYNDTGGNLAFGRSSTIGNTERMRLDSSGNLLVGKTSTSVATVGAKMSSTGQLTATVSGDMPLALNRTTSDGTLIQLRRDNTVHAQIGILGSASGSDVYFASGSSSSTGTGLRFIAVTTSTYIGPCRGDGTISDDLIDLGASSARFDDIYATNGTIQTSDRNEKQDIQELSDAEQRVATACKGLIRRYKFNRAVTEKGDDARYHFGIIAQDLQDAFTAEGLDAGDYGMFISDTYTDDNGIEQTRLGVRYNELLAFIIATL